MSTERVIVLRPIADALIAELIKSFDKVTVGGTEAGYSALFTERSAENVLGLISEAQDGGAKVLLGDLKRDGPCIRPHIITGVKPGMRLWDRESFGPGTSCSAQFSVSKFRNLSVLTELG